MTCEETRLRVADELFGGAQSGEFDHELQQHLASCPACRTEADQVRANWQRLAAIPEPEPSRAVSGRFYAALHAWEEAETHQREQARSGRFGRWWPSKPFWQVAISAGCLAAGLFTGIGVTKQSQSQPAASSTEIAQLHKEMSGMRQLVTLSLLQQQSASERLRGITYSYRAEPDDMEVLSALLRTVNTDNSVDVRLAAVESLKNLGQSPVVRRGLINAMSKQDSPLVQISLIDALTELQVRSAAPALQQLSASPQLDPNVHARINQALQSLQ